MCDDCIIVEYHSNESTRSQLYLMLEHNDGDIIEYRYIEIQSFTILISHIVNKYTEKSVVKKSSFVEYQHYQKQQTTTTTKSLSATFFRCLWKNRVQNQFLSNSIFPFSCFKYICGNIDGGMGEGGGESSKNANFCWNHLSGLK